MKFKFINTKFFSVIFNRRVLNEPVKEEKNVGKNVGKNERQTLILKKVKNGTFNQRVFALEMGVDVKTVERDVEDLKDKIEFVGAKKSGKWRIKNEN